MTPRTSKKPGALTLDLYVYGGEAKASALADYMEARALLKSPISLAKLEEDIQDNSWQDRDVGLIINETNFDDEPASWPDSVRAIIDERRSSLGKLYPFRIKGNAVVVRRPVSWDDSYSRLLRLCIAHNYGYRGIPRAEVVFEQLVVEGFRNFGFRASGVGTGARSDKTFVRAMSDAAKAVGLTPSPNPLPRRRYAKDAKVDVLTVLNWEDGRPGQFTWLTQATLGGSGSWGRKLKEPDTEIWRGYLQEEHAPRSLLAVPHHVEPAHLDELLKNRQSSVVDRLRLTPHLPSPLLGEVEISRWFEKLMVD